MPNKKTIIELVKYSEKLLMPEQVVEIIRDKWTQDEFNIVDSSNKHKLELLKSISSAWIPIDVCWINTGFCVFECSNDLLQQWINVSIPLGTTLNLLDRDFHIYNQLEWNKERFSENPNILTANSDNQNSPLLTDYL